MPTEDTTSEKGNVLEVFKTFLKLGLTSFGGPAAHIGYFRKELVEKQGWVSEQQFGQLLAISQFLPGPASSQLGFGLGLLRSGWLGALAAFLAFTLPSAFLLIAFASFLPELSGPIGTSAIHGLKLVACAVVADAVLGMSEKLCTDKRRKSIAILAAAIMLMLDSVWAQLIVVVIGALTGIVFCKEVSQQQQGHLKVNHSKHTGVALLILFFALLFGLPLLADNGHIAIGEVFYRAGALVFGGGHVVLPLLEDSIVGTGWLTQETFLAGYGAAQAIPGPMFAFSAYLGAVIPSDASAFTTAMVALSFMFLPGFLLISAALPLWQSISNNSQAVSAIAGINAAVVGLLGAALYDPIITSGVTSAQDIAIALVGFGMLRVWGLSPLYVVIWCVIASVTMGFLYPPNAAWAG